MGLGGAVTYGVMAVVWPLVTLQTIDDGLRREQLLPAAGSLSSGIAALIKQGVLRATASGGSVRFFHPLLQEY